MVVEAVVVVAVAAVVVFEVAAPQPGTIFDPPNAEVSTDFLLSSSTREVEVVVVVVVPSSEEEVVEVADEDVGIVVCSCDSFCVGVAVLVLTLPTTRPRSNPPEGWEGAVEDVVVDAIDDEGRVTLPV